MRHNLFFALVLCLGLLACKPEAKGPGGAPEPAKAPASTPAGEAKPASAPAKPAASCKEGETRCEGGYTGEVKAGNNAPAGAQVMICKDGAWALKEACDGAKNMGCYAVEDPATGNEVANCASAFAVGE
jgi:hypothetical protein